MREGVAIRGDPDQVGTLGGLERPDRLGRAISQLLDNAAKFTPTGGTITIETLRRIEDTAKQKRLLQIISDDAVRMDRPDVVRLPALTGRRLQAVTAGAQHNPFVRELIEWAFAHQLSDPVYRVEAAANASAGMQDRSKSVSTWPSAQRR